MKLVFCSPCLVEKKEQKIGKLGMWERDLVLPKENRAERHRGTRVARLVEPPISAQVTIS